MRVRVATLVAVCLLPFVATATAHAATGTSLPLSQMYAMVVDAPHGRVFVSGGPLDESDCVVVTDADGQIVQVLKDLPGASGMVLSPDGGHLYVALYRGAAIADIDTDDLSVRHLTLGAGAQPLSVAVAAGLVWYWYHDTSYGKLGTVDPSSGANTAPVPGQGLAPGMPSFGLRSGLWSNPQRPDELVTAFLGSSPTELQTVKVTGGDAPTLEVTHQADIGATFGALAFTPDGNRIITASGETYYHPVLSADDLSEVADYASSDYPDAVAIRAEDGLVAAGVGAWYGPDVYLFGADKDHPLRTYEVGGDSNSELDAGGLAFGPGGRLYAVKSNTNQGSPQLLVLHPDQDEASIDVTTPRPTFTSGETGHLDVHVGTTADGRQVQLNETTPSGDEQQVAQSTVDDRGDATFLIHPTTNTTLTAVFRDSATRIYASDSTAVTVRARVTSAVHHQRGISGRYALFRSGRRPVIRVRVAPVHADRYTYLQQQRLVGGHWVKVSSSQRASLDQAGQASIPLRSHPRGTRIRARAVWAGDAANSGATGPWMHLRFTR